MISVMSDNWNPGKSTSDKKALKGLHHLAQRNAVCQFNWWSFAYAAED